MTSPLSESSPHLTVAELAKRWHTTTTAIYIRRHRGKAPQGFKSGAKVLFPLAVVQEFEAAQMASDSPSRRGSTVEHRPPEALSVRRPRKPAVL